MILHACNDDIKCNGEEEKLLQRNADALHPRRRQFVTAGHGEKDSCEVYFFHMSRHEPRWNKKTIDRTRIKLRKQRTWQSMLWMK